MEKFATNIERNMAFMLSKDLKKSLSTDEAITSLSKARNILVNAGLETHCAAIDNIIERAKTIDDSSIEVEL
jgi:hypothetical protein